MKRTITNILLIAFLFSVNLTAQTELDTLGNVQTNDTTETFVMTKSPMGAVLRSAVLPGWGQAYNQSYWKIPVIAGFLGYYVYGWVRNNNNYEDYRDLYSQSLNESEEGNAKYLRYREFYKDQRDQFAVWFGIAYFLNLVDAYVDAHLFDFDVTPDPYTHSPQLNIKFKLD